VADCDRAIGLRDVPSRIGGRPEPPDRQGARGRAQVADRDAHRWRRGTDPFVTQPKMTSTSDDDADPQPERRDPPAMAWSPTRSRLAFLPAAKRRTPAPMHEAVIIFNSRSGENRGSDSELSRRVVGRLRERGVDARVIGFDNAGGRPVNWRRRLDEALDAGTRHVYAVGGDGTVLAVARALLERDSVLGIVPTGTANLLARDLGIPLDPMPAVDALLEARPRRIDVGRVNGELFLCASMLGMATILARVRESGRGEGALRLWPRLLGKALWVLWRYPHRRIILELDGQRVTLRSRTLVISNNPLLPEAGLYPRRGRLDGGLLGIYGVREGSFRELPRVALRMLNGSWADEPLIFHHDAPRLTVQAASARRRGRRITVLNDGERVPLDLPLRYEVLPRALSVLGAASRSPSAMAPDSAA
jgi:diacylglycerol kinase family enzyme